MIQNLSKMCNNINKILNLFNKIHVYLIISILLKTLYFSTIDHQKKITMSLS